MKPVKKSSTKKNPFAPEPAGAKSTTKSVIESKPAKAMATAPVAVAKSIKTSAPIAPAPKAPPVVAGTKQLPKASRSATIEAKIDVGFGNTRYLRGEGKGLNWNQGIPLTNVDGSTWQWSGEADEKLKVKLLLNDAVWQKGEDLIVAPGEKVQVAPAF